MFEVDHHFVKEEVPPTELDRITVRKDFNAAEACSAVQFYWNLARRNGEVLDIVILKKGKGA